VKVLYLWDSEYPWDIRVEKTCNVLIKNAWEVHLVCRNKNNKQRYELYAGIHIHRVACLPKYLGKANSIFTFPFFFNPVWLNEISNVLKKNRIDVIIARDLPMSPAAILVGKQFAVPVILDMAECYPELIRLIWKYEPFKISNIFVRNAYFVDLIERAVLKHIDHVFVMVEESKERLLQKGVAGNKISIVSNTPEMERFRIAKATFPGSLGRHKGKLLLLYVGLLNYSRGIDTALYALKETTLHYKNIFMLIIGTGTAEDAVRRQIVELDLENHVSLEGWVDNKLIPEYISSSDICLVPHHKCSHWDNTIPNKLFDYMASAKPVIVSNAVPMERIVHEAKCGMVYNDYDAAGFSRAILKMTDSSIRSKLGNNGLNAINNKYNWNIDSKIMINMLKAMPTNED
jgi:glycosyltransferase involved in cell wall biosynthesis